MLHCHDHHQHFATSRQPLASEMCCVLPPQKLAIVCLCHRQTASHFSKLRFINVTKAPLGRHKLKTSNFTPVVPLLLTVQARSLISK